MLPTQDPHALAPPDARTLEAMSHPIRFSILTSLAYRAASPAELAREMGENVRVVAYHVHRLCDIGAIEEVSSRRRRGATEHVYRALVRPWMNAEEQAALPVETHRALLATTLKTITDEAARAVGDGGFDHPLASVTRQVVQLDPEGVADAERAIVAFIEAVTEIEVHASQRAAEAQEDQRQPFETASLLFGYQPATLRRRRTTPKPDAQ